MVTGYLELFLKILAFWQEMASLTLVSDEDPVPLPGALHPGAVQGVVRLLLQLLKVKFTGLEASTSAQFSSTAGSENCTLKGNVQLQLSIIKQSLQVQGVFFTGTPLKS